MIPEELDKRRILFWDIVNVEARLVCFRSPVSEIRKPVHLTFPQSLMLRRPPNFNRQYIDTRPPTFSSDPGTGGVTATSCAFHLPSNLSSIHLSLWLTPLFYFPFSDHFKQIMNGSTTS